MYLHLLHRNTFIYAVASDSHNEVRLRPTSSGFQVCQSFKLRVLPKVSVREYRDFYNNIVYYFDIPTAHKKLVIEATSEIATTPNADRPPIPAVPWEVLSTHEDRELYAEYLTGTHFVPDDVAMWRETQDVLALARSDVWTDAVRLCSHVYKTFTYVPKSTDANTLAPDALKLRKGVCQDYAHVALGLCRNAGIPARYVSGYFYNTTRRRGENEASHAWLEVHVPGHGWEGYDPTHDRPADERYIKLAVGRDYADIRPVRGMYRGAAKNLKVDVAVRIPSELIPAT
jgi:transglutaminase-like putative cysteine protease